MEIAPKAQKPSFSAEPNHAILPIKAAEVVFGDDTQGGDNAGGPSPVVNVASVLHRSLFRYPGGKTWLVPLFRRWMQSLEKKPRVLVEPFAGGGIIGLTTAFEGLADEVLLVELDPQVAAVWETILGDDADWLAEQILTFDFNADIVRTELARDCGARRDLAFQTLLRNRVSHGGILAKGAGLTKQGESGRGLKSRWYPETLALRIQALAHVQSPIRFLHGDAFAVLEENRGRGDTAFFIDPPYTAGGKKAGSRLYTHNAVDHDRLFAHCAALHGAFLLTYDNADEVRVLAARHGFETRAVAMKNTHHARMTELLVSRDFAWLDGPPHLRRGLPGLHFWQSSL